MENKYNYLIGLKLANPKPTRSLLDFSEHIKKAAKEYNDSSAINSTNPKNISIREINEYTIVLDLVSHTELSVPGKALRNFSQLLIKDATFANTFVFHKQLFCSFDVTADIDSNNHKRHITADDIDDTLFMCSMINYFLNKRDPDTTAYMHKRKAIEKMKILAYECGIVKPDEKTGNSSN